MKKYLTFISFISFSFFCIKGFAQSDNIFTSVPVVNGKVIFQQFIHTNQDMSDGQKYAILNKWGKDNFSGNPSLLSIRFDEKEKSLTVSAKTNLSISQNKANVSKGTMTYRFDASIANMGCMLVIRDISYQLPNANNTSGFVKPILAEDIITDNAVNSVSAETKELNDAVRKSTLSFFSQLYGNLNKVFE